MNNIERAAKTKEFLARPDAGKISRELAAQQAAMIIPIATSPGKDKNSSKK